MHPVRPRFPALALFVPLVLLISLPVSAAESVELYSAQFPEKQEVALGFTATPIAPAATMEGEVTYRNGQAQIQVEFSDMKPAILFGGDITCFVVWAVTRDGQAENLGELITRKAKGKVEFASGKNNFALLVTAESSFLATDPSELVVFTSNEPAGVQSALFTFDRLAQAPRHGMDGIAHIIWDSKVPIELLQARKAFEIAERSDAATYAPQIFAEARTAIEFADSLAAMSAKSKELPDGARRAVALSNQALNISLQRIEEIRAEEELEQRRQETAALEARALEAENAARQAEEATRQAESRTAEMTAEANDALREKERMLVETSALRTEKAGLESTMLLLRQEKSGLESESRRLQADKIALEREASRLLTEKSTLESEASRLQSDKQALEQEAARLRIEKSRVEEEAQQLEDERNALSSRLHSALSKVADTEDSARGFVINLPDILFDLDESDLKPETEVILAKLAGILLIMDGQHALIEGHTDSTGDASHNSTLSERRAATVMDFLRSQGLAAHRLTAQGYGMERPVADNGTVEGRRQNRRVEIVIRTPQGDTVASN